MSLDSRQRINERYERLALTLCQREVKALRQTKINLVAPATLFVEFVDAIEANPVGVCPQMLNALKGLRHAAKLRTFRVKSMQVEGVEVVTLALPFGLYVLLMGAAARSQLSAELARSMGRSMGKVASGLDAKAPNTAEVLDLIAGELLEMASAAESGPS